LSVTIDVSLLISQIMATITTAEIPMLDQVSQPVDVAEDNDVHPPSFYCPISCQVMHDPVVLEDGHTYERRHITKWLESKNTSPVTGAPVPSKAIFPNHAMRNAISEYFQKIFSVHRHAIRKAALRPPLQSRKSVSFGSNAALMKCLDALMKASVLVNADLNTENVLRRIVDEARTLIGAEVASVFLVDSANQQLFSHVNSTGGEIRIPLGAGIAGHVATSGETVLIADAYADARFNQAVDKETGFKTDSILCVPIKTKKGTVIGVAQLINKSGGGVISEACESTGTHGESEDDFTSFTAEDARFFTVFASHAAAAIASSGATFEPEPEVPSSAAQVSAWSSSALGAIAEGKESDAKENDFKPLDEKPSHHPVIAEPRSSPDTAAHDAKLLPSGETSTFKGELPPSSGEGEELPSLLESAYRGFDLDVLRLAQLTNNAPLTSLGMFLFERGGTAAEFGLDRTKLRAFLSEVERGYDDANPYHNKAHAASVLHMSHALMLHGGVAQTVGKGRWFHSPSSNGTSTAGGAATQQRPVGSLETLAMLLAAACHDYGHPGVTNAFLIKSRDPRALRYNDVHPNENHHAAASFALLLNEEKGCDVLGHLEASEFLALRRLFIDLILGTDMGDDKVIVSKVVAAVRTQEDTETLSEDKHTHKLFASPSPASPEAAAEKSRCFEPLEKSEAVASLQLALKAADIGHLAMPWKHHLVWVSKLENEFFTQGDMEKALNHSPVSFLMDRDKVERKSASVESSYLLSHLYLTSSFLSLRSHLTRRLPLPRHPFSPV